MNPAIHLRNINKRKIGTVENDQSDLLIFIYKHIQPKDCFLTGTEEILSTLRKKNDS